MVSFLSICEEAAQKGGEILLDWVGRFAIREKGPADLVTEADLASQEAIRALVLGRYPSHQFIGEEQPPGAVAGDDYCWIVDPLDGTTNYVHGVPHYAVSVALARRGEVLAGAIYDPSTRECYAAARGEGAYVNGRQLKASPACSLSEALVAASFSSRIDPTSPEIGQFLALLTKCQGMRRTGSAALNLCYVAAGRFDCFWALSTSAWDVAAGVLLVEEAGGVVTDLYGKPFSLSQPHPVATAGQALHEEFRGLLEESGASWRPEGLF